MSDLPKIPGYNFESRKRNYGVPHTLNFVNGIRIPVIPILNVGGDPVADDSIAFASENNSSLYDPILTYGRLKHPQVNPFRPYYVLYDRIILTFHGFFRQRVMDAANIQNRIRYVNIMYFMEDDTLTVMEPPIMNCGYPQGRIVRRSRIPKNTNGDFITWKDLNMGIDLPIFGIVYHLTDCDRATREFMRSQGIILNEVEARPALPEPTPRPITANPMLRITPRATCDVAKMRRSIEFGGKVLTFNCLTDDTDKKSGEIMTFKLYYFLEDDTIAIRELKENREGRDYFPMYLKRTKMRKNAKPVSVLSFLSKDEYNEIDSSEFYGPIDLSIGNKIFIFGRSFLLTDCDLYTRRYYTEVLKSPQPEKIIMKQSRRPRPHTAIPEYLGFGTPEDSLASCLGLVPKPPRKDVVKFLLYANKHLRFGCVLQNSTPEDLSRKFILTFSLADDTITIYEPQIRNSGIQGGRFLSWQLVVKPGGNPDIPEYYTSKDLYIGAVLIIHRHEFRLITADLAVYRHMQEHPELFSEAAMNGVREFLLTEEKLDVRFKDTIREHCQSYRENQPQQEQKMHENVSNMNECLENVHLYSNHDENEIGSAEPCTELNEARDSHRSDLEKYPKPILPYHERSDDSADRCQSAGKKSVSFNDHIQ